MRLDLYLCENGYCSTRTEAKKFILSGAVTVDGRVVDKPSYNVSDCGVEISVDKASKKYVSRGGLKLEGALIEFNVSIEGKIALDVGASSGGFTDCLLQHGAVRVFAVDSGSGQLAESLRTDGRVRVYENYNARYMSPSDFDDTPAIAVMDVSFISATYIIPAIYDTLSGNGDFICLIKPQFEVGRANVGKGGIVKDDKIRRGAIDKVVSFAEKIGFICVSVIRSPIEGGDGNVEFLAHFKKTNA